MKKLCEEDSYNVHLHIQYASYLATARFSKDAIKSFEKAASILDNFPEAHPLRQNFELDMCLPLGQLYLEANDISKSASTFKRALKFATNPAILYLISQKLERVQN